MAQAPGSMPPRRRLRGIVLDPAPLRLDRDYRLLWTGQAISSTGRLITQVVLPYQVYVLTNDLLAVGFLSIVQLIPILVFSLGGGAVADSVDRRKLLLITQVALMACSMALVLLALLPAPPLAALYAVAFVSAGLAAVDQPARASSIPRLVPPERVPAAISLNQAMFNASAIVGPAIGGIVLAAFGIAAAYALDVITYLGAIVALLLMHPIPPARGAARASVGRSSTASGSPRASGSCWRPSSSTSTRWSSGRRGPCSRRSPSRCSRWGRRASGSWPRPRVSARSSRRSSAGGRGA